MVFPLCDDDAIMRLTETLKPIVNQGLNTGMAITEND